MGSKNKTTGSSVDTKVKNKQSLRQVVLPIRLGIDSMEKLLVASFKGDPEFEGLEPQVFDDPVNGKGMRVLRYRKDRKVDVYWQRGVHVDRNTFAVGAGIGDFTETTIEPARLSITEHIVDFHIAFIDSQGVMLNSVCSRIFPEGAVFLFLLPWVRALISPCSSSWYIFPASILSAAPDLWSKDKSVTASFALHPFQSY